MSIVPNDSLASVDSLELLGVFGVELTIDSALQTIDTYSRHRSYWKKAVIRNYQGSVVLQYRTNPNDTLKIVQPNAELPLKGWGSYLEIQSAAATPNGIVEFECVRLENALRR